MSNPTGMYYTIIRVERVPNSFGIDIDEEKIEGEFSSEQEAIDHINALRSNSPDRTFYLLKPLGI